MFDHLATFFILFFVGNDPTNSARYHPLYITDSFEGGYGQKSEEERRQQRVYAGVEFDNDGFPIPSACELLANRLKTR